MSVFIKKMQHTLLFFTIFSGFSMSICLANSKKDRDLLHKSDTTQQESTASQKNTNQGPRFKKQRKDGFIVLPLVYYSPDTRWAAGGMFAYHFKFITPGKKDEQSRLSFIQFTSDYTQNKQLDLWGQWRVFMNDNKYIWVGEARYRNYPDRFYGLGNTTPESNEERYGFDLLRFQSRVSRQLVKNVYLGIRK